jgi:alpha-N-arabinofuranosidase
VSAAAVAQLVNCLHALFFADGDRFITTPSYHVFAMHADHQGGQSLRTLVSAPRLSITRAGAPSTFWGLQGSASLSGKRVVLTLVNPSTSEPRETEIVVRGANVTQARWSQLSSTDVTAHNTFEAPDVVKPTTGEARVTGGAVVHTVAPASVTRIDLSIG